MITYKLLKYEKKDENICGKICVDIDGYNIFGNPIDSLDVNNEVFNLLIDGAKARGYKEEEGSMVL